MANTAEVHINSDQDLEQLSNGSVIFSREYAIFFKGLLGSVLINLTSVKQVFGKISLSSMWVWGGRSKLQFQGTYSFNPKTGYTTITGDAWGYVTTQLERLHFIKTKMEITLNPGLKEGHITIEGICTNVPFTAGRLHLDITSEIAL